MLSRRNIRIKVMQVLYAANRDPELKYPKALLLYNQNIRGSFDQYLLNLLQLMRAAQYAQKVYDNKASKLRPTQEDKVFTPKLSTNPLIASLLEHKGLQTMLKIHHIQERINDDNSRLLYNEFAKTDTYKTYVSKPDNTSAEHRQALLEFYKTCLSTDTLNDILEDNFTCWADDKSLVVGAMKKTIKSLPANGDFYSEFEPADETVKEFGEELLKAVFENDEEYHQIIDPTLKNWDADRVAVVDMILLKMALCELLNFPTIPTKVTLNEFVEISKLYSTPKSKDFINGILDRLLKKLEKEGKITKKGRGLIEE
jgi:transcription antitermination protein NusB